MLAKLENVLYWLGGILAIAFIGLAVLGPERVEQTMMAILTGIVRLVVGLLAWTTAVFIRLNPSSWGLRPSTAMAWVNKIGAALETGSERGPDPRAPRRVGWEVEVDVSTITRPVCVWKACAINKFLFGVAIVQQDL
jgi:hypothetical protein